MARVNVYIDAFNLYYGALKGKPHRWLDVDALCRLLFPRDDICRIRYFTAPVSARPNKAHSPIRQQVYFRALRTIPHLTIHLGQHKTHPVRLPLAKPPLIGPKFAEVLKTEEKGSDVNLATYLLVDAFRSDCEVAVVISNDSDLKEPIRVTKDELGVPVGVVNPHPPKKRSLDIQGSFFRQLRAGPLGASQFPPTLEDAKGAFSKPKAW